MEMQSQVRVYNWINYPIELTGGKRVLSQRDTNFQPLRFLSCRTTKDHKCEIDLLSSWWFDFDSGVNFDFGLNRNISYLVCRNGDGMIYISESGQIRAEMEDKWKEILAGREEEEDSIG